MRPIKAFIESGGLIVGFLWGTWHVLIAVWASRGLAGEASLTGFVAAYG